MCFSGGNAAFLPYWSFNNFYLLYNGNIRIYTYCQTMTWAKPKWLKGPFVHTYLLEIRMTNCDRYLDFSFVIFLFSTLSIYILFSKILFLLCTFINIFTNLVSTQVWRNEEILYPLQGGMSPWKRDFNHWYSYFSPFWSFYCEVSPSF